MYAWMGPFIGLRLFVQFGDGMADKVRWGFCLLKFCSVCHDGCALEWLTTMKRAYNSATPEEYLFHSCTILIFFLAATGIVMVDGLELVRDGLLPKDKADLF